MIRLGDFLKVIVTIFFTKIAQIFQYNLYVPIHTLVDLSSIIQVQIYAQSTSGTHDFTMYMRSSSLYRVHQQRIFVLFSL